MEQPSLSAFPENPKMLFTCCQVADHELMRSALTFACAVVRSLGPACLARPRCKNASAQDPHLPEVRHVATRIHRLAVD